LRVQELQAVVEGILGEIIAADAPLMEAGLDSIGSVEVRNAVASRFGVELPATVTFDYPSVEALAGFVIGRMGPGAASPQVITRSPQIWIRLGLILEFTIMGKKVDLLVITRNPHLWNRLGLKLDFIDKGKKFDFL
jgi:acyl carrier protein